MDTQQNATDEQRALLDGWMSRQEAADRIGVTVDTLQRWASRRCGPPYVRIGRKVLYRAVAIRDWLTSRERPGRTQGGGR